MLKHGLPVTNSNVVATLPLGEARMGWSFLFLTLTVGTTIGNSSDLQRRMHMAPHLTMQVVTGGTSVATFAVCSTLLANLDLERSPTVQSS